MSPGPADLVDAVRAGDRAALARVLSLVERGGDDARAIGRAAHGGAVGDAFTLGVTGAPGAGKSTLTSALVDEVRRTGDRVAVLAIDPSSPFSGGALLGDRVRMGDHTLDDGVFIRSMATRGHLGGLAVAAPEAVRVLAVAGYPWVILETVGVGQVEVEVVGHADTTLVVVNKADRPGAREAARDLERMLDMALGPATAGPGAWRPPVLCSSATTGAGVAEVWQAVVDHRDHLAASGDLAERRRRRAEDEVTRLVAARLLQQARTVTAGTRAAELTAAVAAGDLDPWTAADTLLDEAGTERRSRRGTPTA